MKIQSTTFGVQTRHMDVFCFGFAQRVDGRERLKIGGKGYGGRVMEEAQT